MRSAPGVGLRLSTWALTFSGYLALASAPRYNAGILLIPVVLLPLSAAGQFFEGRFRFYRNITSALTLACICVVLTLAALRFLHILHHPSRLDLVTGVIIYIQAYLVMHRKAPKHYWYLFLMSFFFLLISCVVSPDAAISLAMLCFLVSAAWALLSLAIHVDMEALSVQTPAIALATFGGPQGDAQGLRPLASSRGAFDAVLAAIAAAMGLAAFALTVGFFLAMPRFEAGLFGRFDDVAMSSGLSQRIDLNSSGKIALDRAPVMRVEFPSEPGGRYDGPMFWRSTSLDQYEGGVWTRSREWVGVRDARGHIRAMNSRASASESILMRSRREDLRLVRQSIYMDNVPEQGLPALTLLQQIQCKESPKEVSLSWDTTNDFTALMARKGSRRLAYEAWSEIQDFDPEVLRKARVDYREVFGAGDYRRLTSQSLLPETIQLIESISGAHVSPYDKAVAVQQWLEKDGRFLYTLDVPKLDGEHPIDDFILKVRRGHCELFASAMTLMLRSLGVPARVAIGYKGGSWNEDDRSYLVRAYMAHSWVEAYFIDYGWVTFDPSPFDSELDIPDNWLANTVSYYILKGKIFWYANVIGYNRAIQLRLFRSLASGTGENSGGGAASEDSGADEGILARPPLRVALFIVALSVIAAIVVRRRTAATAGPMLTVDQLRAARLFRKLRHRLAKLGIAWQGLTAEEIDESAARHPSIDASVLNALIGMYNEVRFGRRPLSSAEYNASKKSLARLQPRKGS